MSSPRPQLAPAAPIAQPVEIASVRDGVFFTLPDALPRGRHNLTRDQIQSAQTERLLAATTELLAAFGHRGFGAGDIAKRAGVSLAAFYDCFENKDACIFAGYDRFIQVLLTRVTAVDTTQPNRAALVRAVLATYLDAMQSDPVVARAYQVEIDALGPPARARRRNSLELFAAFLQRLIADRTPGKQPPPELSWSAYIGVVYATRQLVSDLLDESEQPDLLALGDDLQIWISDLFRER